MTDPIALQYEIVDIVGLDAWKIHGKEGKLLPPESIFLGIAAALIGDFLKGFLQAESLGTAVRTRLSELYSAFDRESVGGSAENGAFISLINGAKAPASQATPEEIQNAEDALASTLCQFGLDDKSAKTKAAQIRSAVMASLHTDA